MTVNLQSLDAELTWLHDWSKRLTRAETDLGLTPGSLTLSAPTVTSPAGVTVTGVQVNTAGTGVVFKVTTTLTTPDDVTLTTGVTLSNGDVDEEDLVIGFR